MRYIIIKTLFEFFKMPKKKTKLVKVDLCEFLGQSQSNPLGLPTGPVKKSKNYHDEREPREPREPRKVSESEKDSNWRSNLKPREPRELREPREPREPRKVSESEKVSNWRSKDALLNDSLSEAVKASRSHCLRVNMCTNSKFKKESERSVSKADADLNWRK